MTIILSGFPMYKTIKNNSEPVIYKEKGSKFIGYAFYVETENQAKDYIDQLWETHPQATHICYAFLIGIEEKIHRINDDGEPNYSAGQPIYNQILSFKITNVLVAVVRYYGGTKLGVSGLITAYKQTAKECLQQCEIIEKTPSQIIKITCNYTQITILNKLLHSIEHKIVSCTMNEKCVYVIECRKDKASQTIQILQANNIFAE